MAVRKQGKRHRAAAKSGPRGNRNRTSSRFTSGTAGHTYWLYGTHPVLAALENPRRRVQRLICIESAAPSRGQTNATVEVVDRQTIAQTVPPGAVHQGLAAEVWPLEQPSLADLLAPAATGPIVFLDQVTDPQNVGAIMRSASAFGAQAVVTTEHHAPPESGALAKAAAGTLEKLPLIRVPNLARAIRLAANSGFWILGLDPSGDRTLGEAKQGGPTALILGAEGRGLRRLSREACDEIVRLPMARDLESLNVSNAAAVALYELTRAPDTGK